MKFFFQQPSSRRTFMATAAKGILASTIVAPLITKSNQISSAIGDAGKQDTIPVRLPPTDATSEKAKPEPPAPLAPDKRIGFAIVGLGHLSLENILPAFGECKFAKPVALVSGDAEKAAKVAGQYGIEPSGMYTYENFDDIKNNPKVQAVYIVLPNGMHREYTLRALKAGKDVMCEKPMANNSAEAKEMIEAAKAAGRKLMIAYRIQYEPHHQQIKEWVQSKKFGNTRVIEMFNGQHIGDPKQWRLNKKLAGGGSLPDIGLYCLNTARFLTGEEPLWVNATIYSDKNDVRFKEVEDSVLFQMQFPSGTLVNAGCCYTVHESRRYRCMADNGGWFGMSPAFSYKGLKMEMDVVIDKNSWMQTPQIEEKDQFALEMDHFADCLLHNKTPRTTGEEGLRDHIIMEAIYRSAKEGKIVRLGA